MRIRTHILIAAISLSIIAANAQSDSIPRWFGRVPLWNIGAEVAASAVPGTNAFLRGENPESKKIGSCFEADFRAGFRFNPETREGMLYRGLYQGIGIGFNSFFAEHLLGNPVSVYVYQGAPIARFSNRFWFGYEWNFGAAFGWKHYDEESADNNACVSTSVTARMGIAIKLHYRLSGRWQMSFGVDATHFSNGNTSWPNAGVNSVGAAVGIVYSFSNEDDSDSLPEVLAEEADRGEWLVDITAFGAWRKRGITVYDNPQIIPGSFGVAGLQFSPLRKLNRWFAVGPALDLLYDESSDLGPYRVEGTSGKEIRFYRPPFGKQISVGLSAHAELTMPIFSINAGLGYDFIKPNGEKRFFQSLTLKTFVHRNVFINVGYRLGNFKDPQNLMLGLGLRL